MDKNTSTQTGEIKIIENDKLSRYTHAASEFSAKDLRATILKLESLGHKVIAARGTRSAVPNSYPFASKVKAPAYCYYSESRKIQLEEFPLENRRGGKSIPARVLISGHPGPISGWRTLEKKDDYTVYTEM